VAPLARSIISRILAPLLPVRGLWALLWGAVALEAMAGEPVAMRGETSVDMALYRKRAVDCLGQQRDGCHWKEETMRVETKFLRFCHPVEWGTEIDGWKVGWVGGWGKNRLFFYVMVARVTGAPPSSPPRSGAGVAVHRGDTPIGGHGFETAEPTDLELSQR